GSQAFAIAERLGLSADIVADARSRLSENQRAFEETLARIRETEGATSETLERARAAEARAADALRSADDERRRARRERDETVRAARQEAEQLVETIRDEVQATRRALERETVTAPSLDAAVARAEAQLAQLPQNGEGVEEPLVAVAEPRSWSLGERARSRTGGWEGRITALERGGKRATLESGGMRISVPVDELDPLDGPVGDDEADPDRSIGRNARINRSASAGAIGSIQLERARSVASSLDLRGARVDEALDALDRYLDDAALAGLEKATIIHGHGTGALRDAVRSRAGTHPLVKKTRPGERGEGGDGATIVEL
ncbi:MAG TPA: Smr/MutS family protein, partial [Candidatus Limnocylindrales bacterium]|nr:Smr/MutS family protein [Candidatus Limnocylindrales bacterium]